MAVDVVPAIPPESFEDLKSHMVQVKNLVSRVQIDIVDGRYAPRVTWPYTKDEHFEKLVSGEEGLPFWNELDVELDMLIDRPERVIEDWIKVGIIGAIIHIESTDAHVEIVRMLKEAGVEVGFGLKPSTSNERLYELIEAVGGIDFVQCMGSDKIGYSGVALDEAVPDKVYTIRQQYPDMPIAVDIGVNQTTAPILVDAGATKLATTSALFNSIDKKAVIDFFKHLDEV